MGSKTVEFRRHRRPFIASTFRAGRLVRIAYNFDITRNPSLLAMVTAFDVVPAREHPELRAIYPDLRADDEVALITLDVQRD